VDGSFFPIKSQFISAHIIITRGRNKIGIADFICLVAILYCKAYAAELCGALAIAKIAQYIVLKSDIPITPNPIIEVNSNCDLVLSFLPSTQKIVKNNMSLHQIKQEIILIKQKLYLMILPLKVKAHKDFGEQIICPFSIHS